MAKFLSDRQRTLSVGISNYTEGIAVLDVTGSANISGIVTATGGFNLGISSSGTEITSGPIKTLNFVGSGNTFSIDGTTANITISATGGAGGAASVAISTTPPSNPNEGDLWYSSLLGRTFIYYNDGSSSQWVDSAPFNTPEDEVVVTPGKTSTLFTATEGQTSFAVDYEVGYVEVYLNGIRLSSTEYTASDGSSIVLSEGATSGDVLDVVEFIVGIGATGPSGSPGPLENVSATTSSLIHYPLSVTGVGTTTPFITTTSNYFSFIPSSGTLNTNQLIVAGVTTSNSFVKSGGTSSQFLKADGSVDSNTYLTEIGIKAEGSIVGTGITSIDFRGAGISEITAPFAGITTVNITGGSSGGESYWVSTAAGIHTLSNVGIGTTNPTQKLDIIGNQNVLGKIIAGDSINHPNIANTLNFSASTGAAAFRPINLIDTSGVIKVARLSDISGAGVEFLQWNSDITSLISRSLLVAENGNLQLQNVTTGGRIRFVVDSSNEVASVTSTGVGIGTNNPSSKLSVQGDVSIASTVSIGTTIDIIPYDNLGTLSFEGSEGQLFSITNNLTSGSIFSVNDVSGIPSIDVDADGTVLIAPYGSSTEYVGIGTTNPTQTLHVQGNARLTGSLYDVLNSAGTSGQVLQSVGTGVSWVTSSAGITISNDTSTNATRYVIFDDVTSGSVSAANVSSTKLTFNPSTGTLSATVFTSLSDETKKTDITQIENALDIVKEIRGVKYKLIDDNQQSVGVIAQEVEKVLPEVVNTDENGLKSVSYGNIVGVLIEAIKEQQEQINILKDKISELEK